MISDTTWVYLRNRRTTNCVNDLGQVTLKGNAQTEDPLKVKKYNGGLSSSWVGRPARVPAHLRLSSGARSTPKSWRTTSAARSHWRRTPHSSGVSAKR